MSVWNIMTNSLNAFWLGALMVADARVIPVCGGVGNGSVSTVQGEPAGSMINEPNAPLLLCLMRSEGIKLVAPNSTGVNVTCPEVDTSLRPAYQREVVNEPGAPVDTRFKPR